MANLSYLAIGLPASSRLVFRNIHDQISPAPPPVVVTDVIRNFSLREWRQWRRPEDERHLKRLNIEPEEAEVIAEVAERQAQDLHLDEQQRLEELRGEMKLRGLEMQSRHLQALNAERENLINAEISARLKVELDNDDILRLILIASQI